MKWLEYVKLAMRSIRVNLLRSILTLGIIALGIMALVGILTAISGIEGSIRSNFSNMGSNTFTLINRSEVVSSGGELETLEHPPISMDQAIAFKEQYDFPSLVSVHFIAASSIRMQYQSEKSNPVVNIRGVDENFVQMNGYTFQAGRNFSDSEMRNGNNLAILGARSVLLVFPGVEEAIGKTFTADNQKYTVIGVLNTKGSSRGNSDQFILIPYTSARKSYGSNTLSYQVSVQVDDPERLDQAIDEAIGQFRTVRGLRAGTASNFSITRSDKLAETLINNLKSIVLGTALIGIMTLIGAGIGLMNIMLVQVNERTREIGVSKALGATKMDVRMQFLIESILICLMGGILGIILGVVAGNGVSVFLGSPFFMPWTWIGMGLGFCFLVGLLAGIYPAIKAGNLNPVEALRYE